jgi:putative ABC transport system permease protein
VALAYLEEKIAGTDMTIRPSITATDLAQYAGASKAAAAVGGEAGVELHLGRVNGAPAERVNGMLVSANYFALLGTTPALGRAFVPDEDRSGEQVAVLSHGLWRRAFGGADSVVGTRIVLNDRAFTVVGIAPEGFTGINIARENDVWVPAGVAPVVQRAYERPDAGPQQASYMQLVLRMRPGVTEAQAQAEATRLLRGDPAMSHGGAGPQAVVRADVGLSRELRARLTTTISLLMGGVVLVLLIACANVANLLLVRGVARRHEVAIRSSLGASRGRLLRLFLTESLALAAISGVLGITLATWGMALLAGLKINTALPRIPALSPDARVVGFACVVTLLTVVVAGLVPALRSAQSAPSLALREGAAGESRRSRLRQTLIVAQVAICFVLVAGAGLFVQTVRNLRAIDVGFRADNVLAFALDVKAQNYPKAVAQSVIDRLVARIAARPDVEATAIGMSAPFAMGGLIFAGIQHPGQAGQPEHIGGNAVSPDYFRAVGMPVLRGRTFAPGTAGNGEMVINEALAKKFFPGRDPLGERLNTSPRSSAVIVGIVPDAKLRSVREEAAPTFYQTYEPGFSDRVTLVVRSDADRDVLVQGIRRTVAEIDPNLPIFDVAPIDARVRESLSEQYAQAWLVSLFGMLGVLLAAVGLYGVLAFNVTQRARALAIRIALGARAERIGAGVVREGVVLAGLGILVGIGGTWAVGRVVAERLYGVAAFDVGTLVAASLGVLAIAALASWVPARRATRVDPMLVLRGE